MDRIADEIGQEAPQDRPDGGGGSGGDRALWRLRRIDIRSPVASDAWPVARLELTHPSRGIVSDIAKAPGAFDAAFVAASQIIGIAPRLLSYTVRSAPPVPGEALGIQVDIDLELDGRSYRGTSVGVDLMRCSLSAWLDAASGSPENAI